ncbi:MAG: hypothetical protein L0I76_27235 [Pseudonocardia sp.]|nr:hypothetical protein [Pseudonocardia sp.]
MKPTPSVSRTMFARSRRGVDPAAHDLLDAAERGGGDQMDGAIVVVADRRLGSQRKG